MRKVRSAEPVAMKLPFGLQAMVRILGGGVCRLENCSMTVGKKGG